MEHLLRPIPRRCPVLRSRPIFLTLHGGSRISYFLNLVSYTLHGSCEVWSYYNVITIVIIEVLVTRVVLENVSRGKLRITCVNMTSCYITTNHNLAFVMVVTSLIFQGTWFPSSPITNKCHMFSLNLHCHFSISTPHKSCVLA